MKNVKREEYVIDILKEPVMDISKIKDEFMTKLKCVIEEIFNKEIPFIPTEDIKRCEYCDYKEICRK